MLKQIHFKETTLHYQVTGNGPVVMLVHGFGETAVIWDRITSELTEYRWIIPDLPGSGRSGLIEDMSMEGMAESLLAILDNEKLSDCIMIGHSMGGYITLAFAEKYESKLRGFGLFHSTAYADSEEKKETRRKGIDFIRTNGALPFLKTATPNLYAPQSKEQHPEWIEEHIALASGLTEAALIHYYESMMLRPDRTDILKNTKLPVLFILGEADNAVPLADGLQQCHIPDLSFVHVLERTGHMGMIEAAEEIRDYIANYLSFIDQS
jgi:pimeloyl-ACP methyl ester carboxylesterase